MIFNTKLLFLNFLTPVFRTQVTKTQKIIINI